MGTTNHIHDKNALTNVSVLNGEYCNAKCTISSTLGHVDSIFHYWAESSMPIFETQFRHNLAWLTSTRDHANGKLWPNLDNLFLSFFRPQSHTTPFWLWQAQNNCFALTLRAPSKVVITYVHTQCVRTQKSRPEGENLLLTSWPPVGPVKTILR